ncbi:glucose-6-phosphate isomerase [Candidatus Peregrinibacteria bacterium]|nr:glucose-6-phosphate isomerase [Candidatus Peregrinibacteria bacterium]
MLKLDLSPLHKIAQKHGLKPTDIRAQQKQLGGYLKEIQKKDQGFCEILDDQKTLRDIEIYAKKAKGKYEFIVVLGIGGSALGASCLAESLASSEGADPHPRTKKVPTLFVLDNIDPSQISNIGSRIDLRRTLFIVITKSGNTPETMATYLYFRAAIDRKKLSPRTHFVFITDPKKGFLRFIGDREGIPSFSIPPNVIGRFSVLTPVGLLPAALLGINIRALIRGAQKMRAQFLSKNSDTNLPFQLATVQYLMSEKEKSAHVLIPYSSRLIRFADWVRQLVAESTGKEKKWLHRTLNVGITLINALGVTDQHSQFQLYNQGPNDKLIMFIKVAKMGPSIRIPPLYEEEESLECLHKKTFQQMMHAEMEASQKALIKNDRPSFTIEIDRVDEEHLGMLFMLFQGATAFLGEFFDINAFNQPGVALGKELTRAILSVHSNHQ